MERVISLRALSAHLAALVGAVVLPACGSEVPDGRAETQTQAFQNPNAPVYDRNGTLCNVPSHPPPDPSCVGHRSCPSPSSPPSQCQLEYVTCSNYTCPTPMPMPPPAGGAHASAGI